MSDNYLLISTDAHAGLPPEEYRAYIDPRYRELFDEALAAEVKRTDQVNSDEHARFLAEWNSEIGEHGGMRGAFDPVVRTKEMDAEGVAAEVVFPDADSAGVGGVTTSPFNSGLGSNGDGDPTLVWAGARAHNRWLAEFCRNDPERRAGVAIVPLNGEISEAVAEVEWVAAQGLKGGIMIPTLWVKDRPYNDPVYDPVWAACAEAGLPVHTHSGVGPSDYGLTPGLLSIYATEAYWWAARPLWALILGGVFERHPSLKYVLAENGAWWVPDIIVRMDAKWEGDHSTRKFGPSTFRSGLTMKPSEYLNRNCWFAASVMGPVEVDRRHDIGVGNLMWGHDYPHPEGTWPHTRQWLADRFRDVPVEDTRRILGLNAMDVYSFDPAALAPVVDRIGPGLADVHGAGGAK